MDDRIVEFSDLLRRNGIRISVSENMDALRALALLGVADSSLFKNALRATLIKRSIDVKPFDELFDLFFFGLGKAIKESERSLMSQLQLTPEQFQEMLEAIQRLLNGSGEELSALARALLSGDMGQVERLLREAAATERLGLSQNGIHIGAYAQRVASKLGLAGVEQELAGLNDTALRLGASAEMLERISRYVNSRLQELAEIIRTLIKQELKKADGNPRERADYLLQKSFSYYTEEDIWRMNEIVVRLARRFKNLFSMRRKRARRGRFDVQGTLRHNLQYGGVPFHIRLERRKKEKPQVIVLCDISDSVLNASRFMLQFVYSMQELYSKVRSFVFVGEIGEVTRLFEEYDIHQAVEMALKGEVVNVYCHSNFGRAFEGFYREYLSAITGRTTFLIIGDGRNNYNSPNEWVLKEIQQKAKQLIWLNPESRLTWGIGDSEMARYIRYCDVAEECRNINQLYRVIDRIIA